MEFFVVILLVLILILLVPFALRGIGIPRVIAVLIAGIIIGTFGTIPWLMRLLGAEDDIDNIDFALEAMGYIGMIFLMSLAGLEISPKILHKERKAIFLFASLSISIPAMVGLLIAFSYGLPKEAMLLFAAVFIGHSVAIVFAIIKEMKLIATRFGVIILGTSLCTDIAGLLLLAFAVHLKSGGGEAESKLSLLQYIPYISENIFLFTFFFIIVVVIYIFLAILVTDKLTHNLFAKVKSHEATKLTILIVLIFVIVFIGMLIGLHVIIGAFIAGLAIADSLAMKEDERLLHKKMDALGYGIFIPIFFFWVGMNADLTLLFQRGAPYINTNGLLLVLVVLVGAILAKLLSGLIALKLLKFNTEQAVTGGILTIPLLSASLAGAQVGKELGILEDRFFTAVVLLAVLTTLPGPLIAKSLVHQMKIHFPKGHDDIDRYIYSVEPLPVKRAGIYEMMYSTDKEAHVIEDAIYEMVAVPEEGLEPEILEREAYDMIDIFEDEEHEEEERVEKAHEREKHHSAHHKGQ
jgi:Kef-type K+ transport system membrane component KefB